MGKLIFNATTEPQAPVGSSKHTMYVDSVDGKFKAKDSEGNVCSLITGGDLPDNSPVVVSYIVVGGGGGGGGGGIALSGGGGGGGGLVYFKCNELLQKGHYPVIIGMGGTPGSGRTCGGCSGTDTIFNGFVAFGGGGGGSATDCSSTPRGPALTGGNGGGGGAYCGSGINEDYGNSCNGLGYDGGLGCASRGGGGGGASCYGGKPQLNVCRPIGPVGGAGYYSNISGVWEYYGGGGNGSGGGANSKGGGCGGSCNQNGGAGTGYGGGGGGAGWCNGMSGGNGRQGVVIVSYPELCNYNITGGIITCCNGNKIHTFTENGTLCIN